MTTALYAISLSVASALTGSVVMDKRASMGLRWIALVGTLVILLALVVIVVSL